MGENKNGVELPDGKPFELSDEKIASFEQGAYFFEKLIYYRYVNSEGERETYDVKSFLEYHEKKGTKTKDLVREMRLTSRGQLWVDIKNPLFVYWLQQVYVPSIKKTELVEADGTRFEMPEGLRLSCKEEVQKLEVRLAKSTDPGFCSVQTYFEHQHSHGVSDGSIADDIRCQGFPTLGKENKVGIAWIRQIYLPRVKASCSCRC
jgi:hypothetical protein